MIRIDREVWKQAEKNVEKARGSWDAPGFDSCVLSEYNTIMEKNSKVNAVEKSK